MTILNFPQHSPATSPRSGKILSVNSSQRTILSYTNTHPPPTAFIICVLTKRQCENPNQFPVRYFVLQCVWRFDDTTRSRSRFRPEGWAFQARGTHEIPPSFPQLSHTFCSSVFFVCRSPKSVKSISKIPCSYQQGKPEIVKVFAQKTAARRRRKSKRGRPGGRERVRTRVGGWHTPTWMRVRVLTERRATIC